jgi:hypothetical protein
MFFETRLIARNNKRKGILNIPPPVVMRREFLVIFFGNPFSIRSDV